MDDPEQAARSSEHRRLAREAAAQGRFDEFIQEDIQAKIAAAESGAGQSAGKLLINGVPVGGQAPVDVTEQLTRLADLRDRGALSEAEFEKQKAKLLGEG